jgi:hypothetical protein
MAQPILEAAVVEVINLAQISLARVLLAVQEL